MMQALVDSRHMSESFLIDSAGTGGYHIGSLPDSRMRAHARRRGLSLDHRCRQVCESDFTDFDIIIGMCGGYFEIAKLTVGDFEGYCVGG